MNTLRNIAALVSATAFALCLVGCTSEDAAETTAVDEVPSGSLETPEVAATPAATPESVRPSPSPPEVEPRPDPAALLAPALGAMTAGSAGAATGARWRLGTEGLPRNSRQAEEGYWVGSHPEPDHFAELAARGVRVIVSGTRLNRAQRARMEAHGMRHVNLPFGGTFPDHDELVAGVDDVESDEVFIHCEHGGDRSGAMLAFYLSTRDDWPVARAFLSVVYPPHRDRLVRLLTEEGVEVDDQDLERYTGIYSPELNGGFGGLKVMGAGYEKLVRTTLAALDERGELHRAARN